MKALGHAARAALAALALALGASAVTAQAAPALTSPPADAQGSALTLPLPPTLNGRVTELNIPGSICGAAGVLSKLGSIACGVITHGGALLKGGKQLLHGNVGGAVSTVLGGGGAGAVASTASTALGLAAIVTFVVGGAGAVLHHAAGALGASTSPDLGTTWFSSTYWRMAAIAAVLTLPFLFAAAVQALIRSDVALLVRAALGYLPLATLVIAIAAPLTMLLLAACDQLCSFISSAAADESAHFLARAGVDLTVLTALADSPFLAFLVGLFIIAAAFALWVELLLREAAVYVIVLMLPLAFAAFVWPARRIWAIRAVELLVALILSKFAIVAVLSLGGAAISTAGSSVTSLMAGAVLIMLAAFSPWALVRLVPLAELASGTAGSLRGELHSAGRSADAAVGLAQAGDEWAARITSGPTGDGEAPPDDAPPPARATADFGAERAGGELFPEPSSAPAAAAAQDDAPPQSMADSWQSQPVLELGREGLDSTTVWFNPEAE